MTCDGLPSRSYTTPIAADSRGERDPMQMLTLLLCEDAAACGHWLFCKCWLAWMQVVVVAVTLVVYRLKPKGATWTP